MDIVAFLAARIAEEESGLLHADTADSPLAVSLIEECAQKRAILDDWQAAAAAEGINDPADAQEPVAVARRSMLVVLAACYKNHDDYSDDWGDWSV